MRTYSYSQSSNEGGRLYQLLDNQYNARQQGQNTFESHSVQSMMQCRVNQADFIFPSNLSGVQRPQISLSSDVEVAWGEFTQDVSTLDFRHHDQELPLQYTQSLDDEAVKSLIDAGLYSDPRFEELMSKLMEDEVFDAEASMQVSHLHAVDDRGYENPVVFAEPMHIVQDEGTSYDNDYSTVSDLVKRSARLAVELHNDGVRSDDLVKASQPTREDEVYIGNTFQDVVEQHDREHAEEAAAETSDGFTASSDLLDREIDVTDELRDSMAFTPDESKAYQSEDERIRDLKDLDASRMEDNLEDDLEDNPDEEDETGLDLDALSVDTDASSDPEAPEVEDDDLMDFDDIADGYEYESQSDEPVVQSETQDRQPSPQKRDKPSRSPSKPEPEDDGPEL